MGGDGQSLEAPGPYKPSMASKAIHDEGSECDSAPKGIRRKS